MFEQTGIDAGVGPCLTQLVQRRGPGDMLELVVFEDTKRHVGILSPSRLDGSLVCCSSMEWLSGSEEAMQ
jgi:hypothetical protein